MTLACPLQVTKRTDEPLMRLPCLIAAALLISACSKGDAPPPPPRDAAAQRAIDSTIGASKLPGAQGVRGALKVADSAAARRAELDSLSKTP